MHVTGSCHCGAITYEAEVDPAGVAVCHCTDCQVLTGTAYRTSVTAARGTFVLRTGTPKVYIKIADNGNRRIHAFCGNCGSPVYSAAADNPDRYTVRVGCLAQRSELPPRRQIWCRSAQPWSANLEDIPQTAKQ